MSNFVELGGGKYINLDSVQQVFIYNKPKIEYDASVYGSVIFKPGECSLIYSQDDADKVLAAMGFFVVSQKKSEPDLVSAGSTTVGLSDKDYEELYELPFD